MASPGNWQGEAVAFSATTAAPAARAHGPTLAVEGLRHRFGELRVLDGLSFSVQRGEIFGLLGPNGCGKSTTLRVLTGMLFPDAGTIVFDGEAIEPGGRRMRRAMGVVFQSGSLDPRLRARENLRLSAKLYGLPRAEAEARIDELLAFTSLAPRADELVSNFSGGMKRRLELARALLHQPSLLVMDEPTTGLDERFFRQSWERIEALRANHGLTVLLTTHRAEEAERCDRVAVVDRGAIVAEGRPSELRERVAGDVITIEARDPEGLCHELAQRFALDARIVAERVVLEREHGHELIPRLVEALPKGRIDSLSMHRPTLADVFVKLTGRSLHDEGGTGAAGVDDNAPALRGGASKKA